MLPVSFEGQNKIYTRPENWSDDQCMDLPVFQGWSAIDEKGTMMPTITSCWRLSKEDLEEINRTGQIWLTITGCGMPPVELSTEPPFKIIHFKPDMTYKAFHIPTKKHFMILGVYPEKNLVCAAGDIGQVEEALFNFADFVEMGIISDSLKEYRNQQFGPDWL